MRKQENSDSLLLEMERVLKPGRLIDYRESSDYVDALDDIKSMIDTLAKKGEAGRAVNLCKSFPLLLENNIDCLPSIPVFFQCPCNHIEIFLLLFSIVIY